jgi:SpoVK/Ycf46/Vps4 family AAA+-type ATPase
MARSDQIRALFKAFMKRDDDAFLSSAGELIEEERQKGHAALADSLLRILNNGAPKPQAISIQNDVPIDRERGLPLAHIERPEFSWERVILNQSLESTLKDIATEYRKREVFRTYGLEMKKKVLFFGPPGCGKTITARVLAGVLGLPLVYVRFDSVVSSYLGETAANLRKLFDFVARGQWVVLFDEFDAVGKGRDNPYEHGELKRVVNTLLQLMDGFRGDSLLIAATNHWNLLDSAIWRRFDEICYFDIPSNEERVSIIIRLFTSFDHRQVDIREIAGQLQGMTGDDIERICIDAIKSSILNNRKDILQSDLAESLKKHQSRLKLAKKHKKNRGSERGWDDAQRS